MCTTPPRSLQVAPGPAIPAREGPGKCGCLACLEGVVERTQFRDGVREIDLVSEEDFVFLNLERNYDPAGARSLSSVFPLT